MFDSHAHYGDTAFDPDREQKLAELFVTGVTGITEAGTDKESSYAARELAHRYEGIYFAAGLHPEYAEKYEELESWLPELLTDEKCVAIGEIGLDHHYETPDRGVQRRAFEAQMRIAAATGKPVVIHDREAHAECLEVVRAFPTVRSAAAEVVLTWEEGRPLPIISTKF